MQVEEGQGVWDEYYVILMDVAFVIQAINQKWIMKGQEALNVEHPVVVLAICNPTQVC